MQRCPAEERAIAEHGTPEIFNTDQGSQFTPSFNLWSIGRRYKLPSTANYDHSIALNVNNLFDREYLRVNRLIGEKRAILFTYTLNRSGAKRYPGRGGPKKIEAISEDQSTGGL